MKQTYWGLVHTDDDGSFGISFPDFPGCVSAANTMTELVELGTEALNFHIEGMHADGEDIPAPSPVVELEDGAVGIVAITATIPGKKRRINLTLDANLIDLIEAKYGKRAVSSFLEEAGRKAL